MAQADRAILKEYKEKKDDYIELEKIVYGVISEEIAKTGMRCLAIHHRVKEKASLANKIRQHSRNYTCLDDVTDVLGLRIITFFSDDVDRMGKMMEDLFVVDWENSVDKRALIQATAFGYLSLHYICSLKAEDGYPEALTEKKFEVQIRTGLQHIWAEIEHDIGYKNKFGVPREIRREFSKIAGLLEIADDEFVQVRDGMSQYVRDIRDKIILDEARDLPLSVITLTEYMHNNRKMLSYLKELASIGEADLNIVNPESYMERLGYLGIETLGDMENMLIQNRELAYALALDGLQGADMETMVSTIGLRYLCRAELLNRNATEAQMADFFRITEKKEGKAEHMAKTLYMYKFKIDDMNGGGKDEQ